MNERKNIDRLFQEKFRDFETAPQEVMWQKIEAKLLQKEEKRRVIPLWLKISGAAAVLLIGLLLINPFSIVSVDNSNEVVIDNNINVEGQTNSKKNIPFEKNIHINKAVTSSDIETASEGTNKNKIVFEDEVIVKNRAVVYNSDLDKLNNNSKGSNSINETNNNYRFTNTVPLIKKTAQEKFLKFQEEKNPIDLKIALSENFKIKNEEKAFNIFQAESAVIAIAEVNNDTIRKENALEKILKEKEINTDTEETAMVTSRNTKWTIKPQMAPVFYNSLSGGSPIDEQFASSDKDYNNDVSYGMGINYDINDKISIRSGINTVSLGYATNDIQFYASMENPTNNIASRRSSAATITVQAKRRVTENQVYIDQLPLEKFEGTMVQEMGYIEVPMEMAYKVLDERFGINLIGGISTLFLNENNISVVSQGYRATVGEANNLNSIHFSTNVGVGFKYRLWKTLEANFEPTFKYQINTFNNNVGGFKPYFIGLYSGISFGF